jgi:hypothetical protein
MDDCVTLIFLINVILANELKASIRPGIVSALTCSETQSQTLVGILDKNGFFERFQRVKNDWYLD